jgi:hypothetical protein
MTSYSLADAQRDTYRRYAGLALPRHTSYPIAPAWTTEFGAGALRDELRRSAAGRRPLSLYVHVHFCERLCYYCACTKEIVPAAGSTTPATPTSRRWNAKPVDLAHC